MPTWFLWDGVRVRFVRECAPGVIVRKPDGEESLAFWEEIEPTV